MQKVVNKRGSKDGPKEARDAAARKQVAERAVVSCLLMWAADGGPGVLVVSATAGQCWPRYGKVCCESAGRWVGRGGKSADLFYRWI